MSIRVVVVDDSTTMRALIATTLQADPEIEVVGEAADPYEARQLIKQKSPDVITLDIEMPNMNGISFLEKIMHLRPTPVVMVSTLTQEGAEFSLQALEIGAFDCVAKPSPAAPDSFKFLAEKVKEAARAGCKPRLLAQKKVHANLQSYEPDSRLLAIGSSTGGVEALIEILSNFPKNCPPTIISQHMPAAFTKRFSARLDKLCRATVQEAETGQSVQVGHVYLAPGDWHLEVYGNKSLKIRLSQADKVNGHRPSVDVMFKSVAQACGANAVGVILTGLGADGAQGLLSMRQAGALTIGQDEASCIVYGMPKAAYDLGAVTRQYPLEKIATHIISSTNLRK